MIYQFSPAVQALIAAGKYIPATSASGLPLSIVRDAATGQFAAHAVGLAGSGVGMLNPLTAAPQLLMGAGQMYQNQVAIQGIKALSASVATLQATTAVIGVGVAATAALSAVNLWQTLKLRKDVKQMRVELKDGFIDMKQVLSEQGLELIEYIQQVSEDVEFKAHRTILVRAYGLFEKAMNRLQSSVIVSDLCLRNDEITAARNMMFQALSDYDNHQLMEGVCAAAYIRRRECVWAIEQAIAMTYQMQGAWSAASDRLININATMHHDVLNTLDQYETQAELDFLFPEITRIYNHDLAALGAWQNHIDWYQELSSDELNQLNTVMTEENDSSLAERSGSVNLIEKPLEYELYETVSQKFEPMALHRSLLYLFDEKERRGEEIYINERAQLEELTALSLQNLQKASSLTISNLGLYFSIRDESLTEQEAEEKAIETMASPH